MKEAGGTTICMFIGSSNKVLTGLKIDSKADMDVLPLKKGADMLWGAVIFGSRLVRANWDSKCAQLVLVISAVIID